MVEFIRNIKFTISYFDDNRYYVKLVQGQPEIPLKLYRILNKLSGFGVTCEPDQVFNKTCDRLQMVLSQYWDSDIIPTFKFLYVYCAGALPNKETLVWFDNKFTLQEVCRALQFLNIAVYLSPEHTTSVTMINDGVVDVSSFRITHSNELLELDRVHRSWYRDENFRGALFAIAEELIRHFVVTKDLDLYIPSLSVVPIYHIKHFQRAHQILTTLYNPKFIMTLPLDFQGKRYTVLFPVTKEVREIRHP